jgi:hypothetical protein
MFAAGTLPDPCALRPAPSAQRPAPYCALRLGSFLRCILPDGPGRKSRYRALLPQDDGSKCLQQWQLRRHIMP